MLYSFKANVFATKLGKTIHTIVHITVLANNVEQAYKEAKNTFNKYIFRLRETHKADFSFDNLILEEN